MLYAVYFRIPVLGLGVACAGWGWLNLMVEAIFEIEMSWWIFVFAYLCLDRQTASVGDTDLI